MVNLNKGILIVLFLGIIFQVVGAEPIVARFTATPSSGIAPLTVQFTDTSTGNPTRWIWMFDDATGSNLQNPSHIFSYSCNNYRNSTHNVILIIEDNLGNESRAETNIEILNVPLSPVASFSASPSSGPAPLTVQFNDASTGVPNSWGYDFGDGQSSSLKNPSHTYTISGVYTVQMEAANVITVPSTNGRCFLYQSFAAPQTITVLSPLAPVTTTSPTTTTTTAPNTTVTTVTTVPTTALTTATTAPIVTIYTTPIPSPTTKTTVKVTVTNPTPWPTDTPTQSTPLGIEIGIIATIGAAFIVMKQK
jgi:PKD repeat protein